VAYATDVYSTAHSGFIAEVGSGLVGREAVALMMPISGRLFDHHDYQNACSDRSAISRSGLFCCCGSARGGRLNLPIKIHALAAAPTSASW